MNYNVIMNIISVISQNKSHLAPYCLV